MKNEKSPPFFTLRSVVARTSPLTLAPDLPFLALADLVRSKLPYEPNAQQQMLLESLARYLTRPVSGPSVFIVGGYAGTGKTSLVGALVSALEETGRRTVLMAPTGRAAKVFSSKARHPAYTIHRKIYRGQGLGMEGGISILQDNRLEGAVYIVDEASMIGGPDTPGAPSLLDDLLQYVFTPDGSRLILLGDVAQLPPVGSLESPAMLPATFKQLGFRVGRAMLTDTARQAADSGILCNATWLRRAMLLDPLPAPRLTLSGYPDVGALTSDDVIDTIAGAYRTDGPEETIVITRSNQRATAFNIGIRQRIFEYEERLVVGERLLVAKNNYMWSSRVRDLDFIANGDVGHVVAILGQEERYGFCFADVVLRLGDHDTEIGRAHV